MSNMIKNERQYRITKAQAIEFKNALDELERSPIEDMHPIQRQAHVDALSSQYDELLSLLDEYESLQAGRQNVLEIYSIEELPSALIKARIASGLSQKDLGDKIGVKEQQIQRYESTDYQSASLSRISEIVKALGISVREEIFLPTMDLSPRRFFDQLVKTDFDSDFVVSRILPRQLVDLIESKKSDTDEARSLVLRAANIISKILRTDVTTIFGDKSLQLSSTISNSTRFKVTGSAELKFLSFYTLYAHYLATLVLKATKHLPIRAIPTDAAVFQNSVIEEYGELSLETTLRYIWNLGIPVIPLSDPGAFHGACWRENGRNVIVLKQITTSLSKWLYDLLHEIYHAGEKPDEMFFSIIEVEETSPERIKSENEMQANMFAANVLLSGRAEELVQECVEHANSKVERLKSSVKFIANRNDVSVAALANYLASRLSLQGINWWGAATNLQDTGNPAEITRNILFEKVDLQVLNTVEREFLLRSQSNQ